MAASFTRRALLLLLAVLALFFPPTFFVAAYTALTDDTLAALPGPGSDFDIHDGALLAPILIPRVPGTSGSEQVRRHFVDFFAEQLPRWNLTFQNSTQHTPAGSEPVPFVNLILTRDPPWTHSGEVGRLALVAHYDSLREPEGFIGATDSAAPCAMLMHAARTLDEALTRKWEAMEAEGAGEDGGLEAEKGIQIILLDGEEAFVAWTAQDSLYGARSLAAEWENTFHPAMSTFHNQLSSISLFVLLDLLGASNPTVPSWFKTTHWAYRAMAKLETRLRSLGNFKSSPNHESKRQQKRDEEEALFLPEASKSDGRFLSHAIQDDHIPFMARGVEVLHLIPSPFPDAWHNKKGIPDDGEHLDMDTVEDWATLVTAFAAEWMDLEGHFDAARPRGAMGKMRRDESKSEL